MFGVGDGVEEILEPRRPADVLGRCAAFVVAA
ncbi:MAG: hypothetical protein ACJAWY_003113 [Sphingomonas echinoides]|jgi:hypothetical protein